MKLTTRSEYALLAIVHVARGQVHGPVTIDSIRRRYGLSRKYLEALARVLKAGKILEAKRGPGGGYTLARNPDEISIAEIIRLMDGPLAPIESASTYFFSHSPIEAETQILQVFRKVRDMVSLYLENTFISDFLSGDNYAKPNQRNEDGH